MKYATTADVFGEQIAKTNYCRNPINKGCVVHRDCLSTVCYNHYRKKAYKCITGAVFLDPGLYTSVRHYSSFSTTDLDASQPRALVYIEDV